MKQHTHRRDFLRTATLAGIGAVLSAKALPAAAAAPPIKIGIIGLDTEHSVAFTKTLNDPNAPADVSGFRIVAAYPHGSRDIPSSLKMIPGFTEEMKTLGVEIVPSIGDLLQKVDAVLLETNDGRLHLEQALPVFKARKPMFIDKPIAASLSDALAIFAAAKKYNTPVFSSSSLRYMTNAQQIVNGKIGKVLGADAYCPATIEKTHPDLFWYGIHGVEALFTVMGTGCTSVTRLYTEGTDMVVGLWDDHRIGTFRGIRTGAQDFGGTAFGEKAIAPIGPWEGYRPLTVQIAEFFRTGKAPVSPEETLEIFAFMEAAEVSKQRGGASVTLQSVMQSARQKIK
ncbi:MAG TPA: Gfo/Idh/MocA family oxidoreductase [Puia sp.]|nr:Gfo/Idh/MocA family oxidoreductase [Puia sp.]